MRITCPLCGPRDRREFTYQGDALALDRPAADAAPEAWHAYVHLRDNPAGDTRDLWYHDPCGAWIVVSRSTVTHAVHGTELAATAARGKAPRGKASPRPAKPAAKRARAKPAAAKPASAKPAAAKSAAAKSAAKPASRGKPAPRKGKTP